ncbi:hypothetical protein BC830DRAFT_1158404 [Chytriomyces sp. MP71]|nr:hypothetical protein BC830DRAFT_1158404 [Chytriomyces sp. MP71]
MLRHLCAADPSGRQPGCSVFRVCAATPSSSHLRLCAPFNLLASVCDAQLSEQCSVATSDACRTHASVCRSGSLVRQCAASATRAIPSLAALRPLLHQTCSLASTSPAAASCPACTATTANNVTCPDPLFVYMSLCASNPSLPSCTPYASLCSDISTSDDTSKITPFLCGASFGEIPSAIPYLHTSFIQDHVLFDWAKPTTSLDALAACFLASLVAFVYEFLMGLRRLWEPDFKAQVESIAAETAEAYPPIDAESDVSPLGGIAATGSDAPTAAERQPLLQRARRTVNFYYIHITKQAKVRGLRSTVKALEGLALVAIILLCATFNAEICASVILGLAVGAFLFGGW